MTVLTDRALPQAEVDDFAAGARQLAARRIATDRMKAVTAGVVGLVIFLGGWQSLTLFEIARPEFVSDPVSVLREFISMLSESEVWSSVRETTVAATMAMVVGSLGGVATAVVFWRYASIRRGLNPFVTILNALPRPALAPIFIMWFGLGVAPKVLVGASVVYFVLLLNTLAGFKNVQPDVRTLSDSLRIGPNRRLFMIELPSALPTIVAGLRLGAVYAVLGVIVSEIVASYAGLGQMLTIATNSFDITRAFAILMFTAAVAVFLDAIVSLIQRFTPGAN
ncbi:MAG: ABC transporter permease [Aeromicrobium sp.]|uniref:ABC transporter permease n=1 Tax=Aeromicrobium sp. TaxID=1871063 RepID=UPI00262C5C2E|nr:ABC transporter permease [Aeromicrobium sp.]MDF1706158.1 ABC transporter permease [Aeromicrobium sp.]